MIALIDAPGPDCARPASDRLCLAYARCADFTLGEDGHHWSRCRRDDPAAPAWALPAEEESAPMAPPAPPPSGVRSRWREDCAHLAACRGAFVTPRTKEPEDWRCPADCPDYAQALVPATALVRGRGLAKNERPAGGIPSGRDHCEVT